ERIAIDDAVNREQVLESGDVIELGSGDRLVQIAVTVAEDPDDARIMAMRKIDDLTTSSVEKDSSRLRQVYEAQQGIGSGVDLGDVLTAICDASFRLVPQATHVTIILRDDDEEQGKPATAAGYVPVLTRVRGQDDKPAGPIPITRSVFRKVITE